MKKSSSFGTTQSSLLQTKGEVSQLVSCSPVKEDIVDMPKPVPSLTWDQAIPFLPQAIVQEAQELSEPKRQVYINKRVRKAWSTRYKKPAGRLVITHKGDPSELVEDVVFLCLAYQITNRVDVIVNGELFSPSNYSSLLRDLEPEVVGEQEPSEQSRVPFSIFDLYVDILEDRGSWYDIKAPEGVAENEYIALYKTWGPEALKSTGVPLYNKELRRTVSITEAKLEAAMKAAERVFGPLWQIESERPDLLVRFAVGHFFGAEHTYF